MEINTVTTNHLDGCNVISPEKNIYLSGLSLTCTCCYRCSITDELCYRFLLAATPDCFISRNMSITTLKMLHMLVT